MWNRYRIPIVFGIAAAILVAGSRLGYTEGPTIFVSAEQLDVASVLPNPPGGDSREAKAELALLHELENTRTAEAITRAQHDDGEEDIFVFKDVIGPKFDKAFLPLTALLSDHVHANEGVIVNPAKSHFHRPRPYRFDPTLKPVCKVKTDPTDYAYPSGHGTSGYLEALVLTMMVPEKRNEIMARADDYAHNRLVCGVHWGSDVVASKAVAYAMIGLMMNNPQFKKELAAARLEVRQVLGPSKS